MSELLKKPGVLIPVALFIVAAVVALILTVSPAPPRALANSMLGGGEGVDANDVELLMRRIGATPETLAAAGLTSNEAGNVVAYAHAFLQTNATALDAADQAVADARASYETLRRRARSGLASPQDLSQLTAARTALDAARTAQQAILDEARDDAYTDLTVTQKNVLQAVVNASANSCLGVAICAASHTETDWDTIRRAAGAIRSAAYNGEEPDAEALTIIDDAQGQAATVAAQANIDVRLVGIAAAVATALGNV